MWERKVAGVKHMIEQLLQAPKVPKSRHLGQPIYLNSTPKLALELALKKWPQLGSIFSLVKTLVITDTESPENIDPIWGQFFKANSSANFGVEFK